MGLLIKLLFKVGIGVIGVFLILGIGSMVVKDGYTSTPRTKAMITSGIVVAILAVALLSLIEVVPNGHRGIKYNINGGVEDGILLEGWHIVKPVLKVTDFPVYVQTLSLTSDSRPGSKEDDSFLVPSKDGKQVRVGVEMNYRFAEEELPSIFRKYGGKTPRQIEDYHMKGKVKAWSSEATTLYPIIELYGEKKTEATQTALNIMKERFALDGIIVESFEFVEITPDSQSIQAIQDKVNASQKLETLKTEEKQAEVKANIQVIEAEAKARAKIVEAEGERKANELMERSLTEGILMQQWIEKWDGKLPVVSDSNGNMMIDISKIKQ